MLWSSIKDGSIDDQPVICYSILTDGTIILDSQDTGLRLKQTEKEKVIFADYNGYRLTISLPEKFYQMHTWTPENNEGGMLEFERDLRLILNELKNLKI